MGKVIFFLIIFILTVNHLWAKDKDTASSDSITIEEITVNAFHYQKRLLDTPGAISIISTDQISKSSNKPVDYLVNQIPGVYMQSGTLNTNRLSIRGIGSRTPYSTNKIRAYFEGIPLTNGVGETSIEDLDLSMISKIEIIKGPSSGFYGSGLGGTLLFEAKQPRDEFVEISTEVSSFGTYRQNASVFMNNNEYHHSLHISNLSSDGYRENNETDRTNITYLGKLPVDNHEFDLLINHTSLKAFIPSSIDLETFTSTPEKAASNWAETEGFEDYEKITAGFSVVSEWKRNWETQISIFGNQFKNYELRPFNILQENSYYYGNRIIFEKKIQNEKSNWSLIFGNETFFENYEWATFENISQQQGEFLSENKEKRNYINLFLAGKADFNNKLLLSFGANVNTTHYNYTDLISDTSNQDGKHRFKTIVSPRLALSYPLTPTQRVFANISHGFSPPTLEESLLPGGNRNPEIQPETGWNFELGSRGSPFSGFYYDISAYYMSIKNLLVSRRINENEYMGINAGKSAHPGIEYLVRIDLLNTKKSILQLTHNGTYSPAYFIDFIDNGNDYSNNELTGTPKFISNNTLDYTIKSKFNINLQHQYTGSMPLHDDNSIYSDNYSLFTIQSSYKTDWKLLNIEIIAGVYNLFDKKYASMLLINANSFGGRAPRYYYPGLPRNYSLKLKISYSI